MKVKKTFRLSEDIIELIDNRDQRKYPSREFFLESALRNFSEIAGNRNGSKENIAKDTRRF